ncbi:MAG: Bug family tripartite tricarboxylate transporter substrate binding protein [Burkholderiales bacterium]
MHSGIFIKRSLLTRVPFAVLLLLAALAIEGSMAATSYAQDYPNKSVRVIVPYAPGGQPDIVVRLLSQHLGTQLGQAFLVENIPGANGIAAVNTLLKQPADGYVIAHGDGSTWGIAPAMNPKLPYDPLKDFAPIGLYGQSSGLFLVVNTDLGVASLQELIALAKAKPGTLAYASAGIGSIHHLIMEDFKATFGADLLHVPYKGSGQTIPALAGGQVGISIGSFGAVSSYVKEGRIKILSVSTQKRSALAPDVPTMAEATGKPDFEHGGALGLLARAGTSRGVIEKLNTAMSKALALPEVQARINAVGLEPVPDNRPEAQAEHMRYMLAKYTRVVKNSGIRAE